MSDKKLIEPVILHLHHYYGNFGIGSIIFGGLISASAFFNEGTEGFHGSLPVFGFFAFLGLLLLMGRWIMKVIVHENKITKVSLLGTSKEMQLAEIIKVKFNKTTLELKLSDGKKSISCHQHLVGFSYIIEKLNDFEINTEHLNINV
ncbi:MAG: hypothetical protein KDC92_05150 [Bacteroidetes bacterium]|nr:hypothetical protein [Bacteroidota bacterium]